MAVNTIVASFGGVYLTSFTEEMADHLAEFCDPNEVLSFNPTPTAHDLAHLPIPPLFQPPPVRPNVLSWPTDASRFATCHVIIDDTDLATIRPAAFTTAGPIARTLTFTGDDETITCSMFALPPRPLARILGVNGLWLLPLVDARYFWWSKSADLAVTEGTTTWANLFSAIGTALGETITVSTIDADFGTGPSSRFNLYRQPLPLVLDAAAKTIGMRVVRRLDGSVRVENYTDANTVQDAQIALITSGSTRSPRSGGLFRIGEVKRSVPDTVVVVFPRKDDGDRTALQTYSVSKTLASLALAEYTASGTVTGATDAEPIVITTGAAHGLASGDLVNIAAVGGNTAANANGWAITVISATIYSLDGSVGNGAYTAGGTWTATIAGFDGEKTIMGDMPATYVAAVLSNAAALASYATQAATDWYRWQVSELDEQFNGIVNWLPNGQIDVVEWHFERWRCTTRVSRDPYNDWSWGLPWPEGLFLAPSAPGAHSRVYGQANSTPALPGEGPRQTVNLIRATPTVGNNLSVALADDAGNDRLDWTFDNLGVFGRVNDGGTTYGARRRVNLIRPIPSPINAANLSVAIADDAVNDELDFTIDNLGVFGRAKSGTTHGPRRRVNMLRAAPTVGNNLDVTAADDAADDEVEFTFDNLGFFARRNAGTTLGARRRVNLIDTSYLTWTLTDDAANDEFDVTPNVVPSAIVLDGGGADWHYYRHISTSRRFYNPWPVEYTQRGLGTQYNGQDPYHNPGYQGNLVAVPYLETRGGTLDRIGIYVGAAATAGTKVRLGIYLRNSVTDLNPNTLVVDAGEVLIDALGLVEATIAVTLIPRTLYWLAIRFDSTINTPALAGYAATDQIQWAFAGVNATTTTDPGDGVLGAAIDWNRAVLQIELGALAALPDPFPIAAALALTKNTEIPLVFVRYSA